MAALSDRFLKILIGADPDLAILTLLTVSHPDLPAPHRFVDNTVDVTSRGELYTAFPFRLALPESGARQASVLTIQIDNVDRRIAALIRTLQSPPRARIELVLDDDPDTVEYDPGIDFIMRSSDWDATIINARLAPDDDSAEPACSWAFNPANAPALFAD